MLDAQLCSYARCVPLYPNSTLVITGMVELSSSASAVASCTVGSPTGATFLIGLQPRTPACGAVCSDVGVQPEHGLLVVQRHADAPEVVGGSTAWRYPFGSRNVIVHHDSVSIIISTRRSAAL